MKKHPRYFVSKPGAAGTRYIWQPAATLRAAGWLPQRLDDSRRVAIGQAEAHNVRLDAWRQGGGAAPGLPAPPAAAADRTLAAAIACYMTSRQYTACRARTQDGYRYNLGRLAAWGGNRLVRSITPAMVDQLYEQHAGSAPAMAAAMVTMLRIVLSHAMRHDAKIQRNAAAGASIPRAAAAPRIWPAAAVPLFIDAADALGWPSMGTAIRLAYWTGQREGDLLALPCVAVAGDRLRLVQSKTGASVSVPLDAPTMARVKAELGRVAARLRPCADGVATLLPAKADLLLCEATGRPWTDRHFRQVFARVRDHVALAHPAIAGIATAELLFRHLRHTAVTELAIGGATALQIAGMTGHSPAGVDHILVHYLARTADLADAAVARRVVYLQGAAA